MISEYAIDPGCVKLVEELMRVLAGMGGEHGRVIAELNEAASRRSRSLQA